MGDGLVIEVTRTREGRDLSLPRYMTPAASGMDLLADVDEDVTLAPLQRALIPSGVALALPPGYEGQVRPRSGLALRHGVTVLNAPGTIDADYRGEIKVLLVNLGSEAFVVRRGDRIAQLVIGAVARAELEERATLATTLRGGGGFGHTDGQSPAGVRKDGQ